MSAPESQGRRGRGDGGTVTAETAVVLPVVVLALAVVLTGGALSAAAVACVDSARATARALARGDDAPAARAAGEAVLRGPGDVALTGAASGMVAVTVTTRVRAPGARLLPSGATTLSCTAHAWREPGP